MQFPPTFEDYEKQQEALRPAVEAAGFKWEPDKWSYFMHNGQLQREESGGRTWTKGMYKVLIDAQEKRASEARMEKVR